MVTVYVPPPSASEVMDTTARWVARLYGVKVTVKLESLGQESNTVIDGRPQTAPLGTALVGASNHLGNYIDHQSAKAAVERSALWPNALMTEFEEGRTACTPTERDDAIEREFKARDWPTNPKNAARAGWYAALRAYGMTTGPTDVIRSVRKDEWPSTDN